MYWLIKGLSKFLSVLPEGFCLSVGEALGFLFFLISGKNRGQALKNIKLAFPDKRYGEIVRIAKRSFQNFGMSIIDTLRISEEIKYFNLEKISVEGRSFLSSVEEQSSIFTGIHMGSWEFLNIALAKEFPYAIIVRRQKNKALDRFLNEERRKYGLRIIYEDDLRSLADYLKSKYVLGIVFDHGSRNSKIFSEFFGKKIPVPVGVLKLSLKFKRKIFSAAFKRESRGSFKLKIFPPLEVKNKDDFNMVAKRLNSYFEGFLKANPEDYLWWYKRFKRSKNLNILVLSDRKAGHIRQSLSLANLIEEKRPGSFIEVADIKLSNYKRAILDLFSLFSSRRCVGCFKCLRLILGKDFERIFKYADLVISCGSSLSSLNRILSYSLDAKSFIIQKPNLGLRKFDLVILPFHDKAPELKNIVRIKGSFSLFKEKELQESKVKLKEISKSFKEDLPKIGIFIGGPLNKSYNKDYIFKFLKALKETSLKNSWQLFITTSRRTPTFVEDFLEEQFKDIPLLIIANKENFPFVSLGIIGLCDVILVSSDSISMITEANSLKPTLVFDAFGVAINRRKHANFLENIISEGYAKIIDAQNLEEIIEKVLRREVYLKNIDNKKAIEAAIISKL